jgi:EAL domain-containing protein (putative c-di-GMP-specific phosphodiesterase class I)
MPQFDSGAAKQIGRFSEGLLLRLLQAIIGLARELDIEVIAQGVETEAQRDLLTCVPSTAKVQGYYYSAPVPESSATDLLRQRLIEPRLSQVSEATAAQ